jgi:hypothetical protein
MSLFPSAANQLDCRPEVAFATVGIHRRGPTTEALISHWSISATDSCIALRGNRGRVNNIEHRDQLGAREGWLALFDRSDKPWDEKIRWETLDRAGRTLHVAGC